MAGAMAYGQMMADMGMSVDAPWTATDVFVTFVMWSVMMVGMMAPSAAPVMMLFAAMQRSRGAGSAPAFVFGAGYLVIWTAFSVVAALAQWALHNGAMLSPAMAVTSGRVGAVVLIAAGIYQLTPLKGACLTHCRTPLGFLMSHWREGTRGALAMGIRHGAYCVGCCWALMILLFIGGVMNLLWVAGLTLVVLVEKVAPGGIVVSRTAGALMIGGGLIRLFVS
jgi:predicted metal-binding membrane protein